MAVLPANERPSSWGVGGWLPWRTSWAWGWGTAESGPGTASARRFSRWPSRGSLWRSTAMLSGARGGGLSLAELPGGARAEAAAHRACPGHPAGRPDCPGRKPGPPPSAGTWTAWLGRLPCLATASRTAPHTTEAFAWEPQATCCRLCPCGSLVRVGPVPGPRDAEKLGAASPWCTHRHRAGQPGPV